MRWCCSSSRTSATARRTSRQLINETIGKTGENIQIKRFARFELGE